MKGMLIAAFLSAASALSIPHPDATAVKIAQKIEEDNYVAPALPRFPRREGAARKTPFRSVSDLAEKLREADVDKASSSQYKVQWGDKLNPFSQPSGQPLFKSVDNSLFDKKVYKVLRDVYDNDLYKPDLCDLEANYNSGFKKTFLQTVLDAWSETAVFKLMHDYLVDEGLADSDVGAFKEFLFSFWFRTYSRCKVDKKIYGSSGFEHVFIGEWKTLAVPSEVDGQHNWMKYHLLEQAGKIKYYGYQSYDGQLTGTFEYDWEDVHKPEGGFLIGTSPAFDFSLFTACALAEGGKTACRFSIDDFDLAVTSYLIECGGINVCLATSYPVDKL